MPSSVFIPVTVFVLKLFLGIFHFLLVQAVGAGLAIYSKIGGDYANNIRWMRQGGYLEMITSLFTTREGLPGNARIALFVTIVVSFVASVMDTGVSIFILSDERPIHPESMFTTMNNYAPSDGFYMYLRWTSQMYMGDNITAQMDSIVNNPDSVEGGFVDSGRQYQVRTSDYNVQHCLAWDFHFPGAQYVYNSPCATMVVTGLDELRINYSQANTTALRDGRWSISALTPLPTQQSLPQLTPAINATTYECANGLAPLTDFYTDTSNLKQPPRTYTTKCVTNGGDITVLTYSSTRFKVRQSSTYSAATANIFQDTSDELLNAMQVSISNSPAQTLNTTLLMEIKISNLMADVLYCYTDATDGSSWSCGYLNINGFLLEKQELDPQTANKLAARTIIGTPIVIEHIPHTTGSDVVPFALQTLRDATGDVAKYMASLGNNFVTEDIAEGDAPRHLFVFYEASTFKKGFVVPVWVLCFVGVLAAFAIGIWATAHFLLGEKYTTSFYKSVTKKVAATAKRDTAALLKSVAVSIVKTGMELALDEGLDRLGDGLDGLGDDLDRLDITRRDVEKAASKKEVQDEDSKE
ncbi:hypothetical protein BGZ98_004330 [Dissophora globulifera]|nr:hypothetical protein BGZ98_004330 [Dissophora globulifera]